MRKDSSWRSAGRVRGESGLTLVEVAVAVFVLALVLVLAAPAMPRSRSGADAAAHALAQVLDRGRLAAVRGGIEVAVEVDAASGAYRVVTPRADGADSLLGAGAFPFDSTVQVTTPDAESRAVLRFGPLGRGEGGPVRMRDGESGEWVVAVNPWTGRVRVGTE